MEGIESEALDKSVITTASGVLEMASRAILVAYGVGFFVESYFDARYGVTYLNPFHSRIAYTGIGLLIQIAVVAFVLNAESVLVINSSYWKGAVAKSFGREKYKYSIPFAIAWITETAVLGFVLRFIFAFRFRVRADLVVHSTASAYAAGLPAKVDYLATLRGIAPQIGAGVAVFILLTITDVLRRRRNRTFRDFAALVAILAGFFFVYLEFRIWDPQVFAFSVYVLIIRLGFMLYRQDRHFRRKDLRLAAMGLGILLPTYYAKYIYPNVLPQWGGAAKTRLWIKFQHDIVPFGVTSPAFLLEETEEGYYLLRDPEVPMRHAPAGAAGQSGDTVRLPAPPTELLPEPNSYSAIYVPRSEVIQVLYQRSDDND